VPVVVPAKIIDLVMEATNYDKARELWYSFHDEVKYHHRFFPSHPVLDKLAVFAEQCKLTVNAGKIYYRARIIDDNALSEHMIAKCFRQDCTEEERNSYHNKNNKFRGLSKEGSYVPPNPDLIRDGRSNPKFIRYLYIAESPTTAVFEVRPLLHNAVNVAGIEVKEQLIIANIAVGIDIDATKDNSVDEWLMYFIQTAFSSSTNNPDDYIASQIIAEYIRHLGYDGIRYSSSLHRGGCNLTVFDVEKCEAVSSTDLRLEDIKMSLRPAIGAVVMDGRFEYIKDNIPMKWDNGELVKAEV
jgi:RES domain-containing protein